MALGLTTAFKPSADVLVPEMDAAPAFAVLEVVFVELTVLLDEAAVPQPVTSAQTRAAAPVKDMMDFFTFSPL